MSEFRRDPVADHWVIIAPNRAGRPEQYEANSGGGPPPRCPFCRGHEEDTPTAVAEYARPGSLPGESWQVRVIPNKFPAVEDTRRERPCQRDFFESRHGIGVHEVVVEAPDHVTRFSALDREAVSLVFRVYRDRLIALSTDNRLAYAQIFKNSGSAAGASLEHLHSQLIGTPVVPTQVQSELSRTQRYWAETGRCVYCEMIARERQAGERLVCETPRFVAFCPYASQFPYETWILPRRHSARFETAGDEELGELGELVRSLIDVVERTLNDASFNYLIHTMPFRAEPAVCYHWHLEFFPRVTKTAGFEWGAGDYINTVCPEHAAAALRLGFRDR